MIGIHHRQRSSSGGTCTNVSNTPHTKHSSHNTFGWIIKYKQTMPPYATSSSATSKPVILPGAKTLQDQLHDLISRFTLASEHIKNWNESGSSNDATAVSNAHTHNTTIHAESTSRLLLLIQEGLKSLQKVEATLKTDTELRQVLMNIHVPYDLLELLDYTNINPDLYLRGLVNEATQQLVGLQRRKSALHLLSTTIEQRR